VRSELASGATNGGRGAAGSPDPDALYYTNLFNWGSRVCGTLYQEWVHCDGSVLLS
jgi:hypothetical protein